MEKKKSRVVVSIFSFIGAFLLGGIITFGGLYLFDQSSDDSDNLKTDVFKLEDVYVTNEDEYLIENINPQKSEVVVKADDDKLAKVDKVVPELTIKSKSKDMIESGIYNFDAVLKAYDAEGNELEDVEIVPNTIRVEVDLLTRSKKLPIKVFSDGVPIQGRTISKITVNGKEADEFEVVIQGDPNVLAETEYLPVTIDVEGTGEENTSKYNVVLAKSAGITDISIEEVEIVVHYADAITKEIQINNISVENLAEGLAANRDPSPLIIRIEGTPEVINEITADDITAYVDLEGLDVGEHEVEVYIASDYYFVYSIANIAVYIYEK